MPAATQPASSSPESSFEQIQKAFLTVKARREDLIRQADQIQLALNLATQPASQLDRATVSVAEAGEFLAAARQNPQRLIRQHERLIEQIEDNWPEFSSAKAAFDAAASVESARIAQALAPRHRAAVAQIATALQALDRALVAETEIRDAFAKAAPPSVIRQSSLLPDMAGPFLETAWLAHWDSAGAVWLRNARSLGLIA